MFIIKLFFVGMLKIGPFWVFMCAYPYLLVSIKLIDLYNVVSSYKRNYAPNCKNRSFFFFTFDISDTMFWIFNKKKWYMAN